MNTNLNPLNVKQGADHWRGSIGTDDRGHAIFLKPEYGIRAAMRTLQAKWDAGKKTLAEIIASWAPADDTQGSIPGRPANDPDEYAGFVAVRTGLSVVQTLPDPRLDVELWFHILAAMAKFEMGQPCPVITIMAGIVMWYDDFVTKDEAK